MRTTPPESPAPADGARFDADGDPRREESLSSLLGGGRAALEASVPPNAFLAAWLASGGALAWAVSILVRWPLLGVIVGGLIGTRTRWRRDPALLRAYARASWIWLLQHLVPGHPHAAGSRRGPARCTRRTRHARGSRLIR